MLNRLSDSFTMQAGRPLDFSARSSAVPSTIFVIDHDAAVRDALAATLRACGKTVSLYSSASRFLNELTRENAGCLQRESCLLAEFDLSDMTGLELLSRLQAHSVLVPTILMSARLRPPVSEYNLPTGVVAVLQKPFGQEELYRCLRRATNDKQDRKQFFDK